MFSDLKSTLTDLIEAKFRNLEKVIYQRLIMQIDRQSTCHEIPVSVSSEICLAVKK